MALETPTHVAFIPDGNRRFGRANLDSAEAGHKAGVEVVKDLTEEAIEQGVTYLTFYIFSTENWKRSETEIGYLMELFKLYFTDYGKELEEKNVVIKFIGRRDRISNDLQKIVAEVEERSSKFVEPKCTVTFALDYGGQDELVRAFGKLLEKSKAGQLEAGEITLSDIESSLDTAGTPPPDMIVRTSGEQRLSNYLLWQAAYAELYFAETPWPAFTKEEFKKSIDWYQTRDRRKGGDTDSNQN